MIFQTEQLLVDQFLDLLEENGTPWGAVQFACEFDYARGRTDVIAVSGENTLIAFEAKLKDWKTALHQAYRNTCFAHQSFVLLPKLLALTVADYLVEFERRGVGLCYIDGSRFVVLYEVPSCPPIEPWLANRAISLVTSRAGGDTRNVRLCVGVGG